VERVCEDGRGLRVERVDRDRAFAESLDQDRPFEYLQQHAWPEVDKEKPGHDHHGTEDEQVLQPHVLAPSARTIGGTL